MADNNFKIDIGGMRTEIEGVVRTVDELTRALEKLGMASKTSFGNLGQSLGSVNSATHSAPVGPADYLTTAGSNNHQSFEAAIQRGNYAERIQKAGINSPGSPFITSSAGDQVLERSNTRFQTKTTQTGFTTNNIAQAIADREAALLQQQTQTNKPQDSLPAFAQATTFETRRAAFGYGVKDIERLGGETGKIAGMDKSLGDLAGSFANSNKELSKALTMLQTDLKTNQANFQRALDDFRNAEGDDDQKRAMVDLTHAMKELDASISEGTATQKQIESKNNGAGGGGNDGGFFGGMDKREMFQRFANPLLSAAVGVGSAYFGTDLALKGAVNRKEMDLLSSEASIAQNTFKTSMESADMTKAENILKYQGDRLYNNDRFKYLGQDGMSAAMGTAKQMGAQEEALLKAQRNSGLMGNLGQIGMGTLAMIGGGVSMATGAGAPIGALAMMGGATSIVSGAKNLFGDYYTNPLTLAEGGVTGSNIGSAALALTGTSRDEMRMAEMAAKRKLEAQKFSDYRALQEAELQANPTAMLGTQEYLNRQQTQIQAALLVGRYAPSANSLDDRRVVNQVARDTEANQAAEQRIQNLQRLGMNASGTAFETAESTDRRGTAKDTMDVAGSRKALQDKIAYRTVEEEQMLGFRKSQQGTSLGERFARDGRPIYAQLGMSASEFMMSQAQMTNVLGGDLSASQGATANYLRMSKGGLGSFGQFMSQLGSMNQIAGGNDNTQRLESVMVSAVSAGFDKSRMAQQFVSTTVELAKAMQVSSPESVAKDVSLAASVMSITGRADEKSLSSAAKGISELANITGQGGGAFGALKLMGAYSGGVQLGQGAGILQTSNLQQMLDYQSQIESGKITDPRVDRLVRLSGGRDQALKALSGSIAGVQAPMKGLFSMVEQSQQGNILKKYGVSTIDEFIKLGKGLTGAKKDDFFRDASALGGAMSEFGQISEEAGQAMMASQMTTVGGMSASYAKSNLDKAVRSGMGKSVTEAQKNLQTFISQVYTKEVGEIKGSGVDLKSYQDFVKAMPDQAVTTRSGKTLTAERVAEIEDAAKKRPNDEKAQKDLQDAKDAIKDLNKFDMAQAAGYSLAGSRGEQRVYVTNMRDIVLWQQDLAGKTPKGPAQ